MKSKRPETTNTCEQCGTPITTAVVGDALCPECRYEKPKTAPVTAVSEYEIALKTYEPPLPGMTVEAELIERLLELGITIPDPPQLTNHLQPILDKLGDRRAALILHKIFSRLKGKRGEEIRLAIYGALGIKLKDHADRLGITKQTLWRNIQRLRKRIFAQ